MQNKISTYIVLIFTALLFIVSLNGLYAKDTKKILIVHSYHPEYRWVVEYRKGLMEGLQKYRSSVLKIEDFYLDSKRHPESINKMAEKAYIFFKNNKPDVVIAADDPAQKYFVVKYLSNKVKTPVVFLGVNGNPEDYGYPSRNVTGVLERINIRADLGLIHTLVPEAKTFGIIMDSGLSSQAFLHRWKVEDFNFGEIKLKTLYIAESFEEWKMYINKLEKDVDVIYILSYYTLKDRYGKYVKPEDVVKWYVKNCDKPEVTANLFSVKLGLLCSYGETGWQYGMVAGKMVVDILNGKPVKSIPVVESIRGLRAINRKRAKMLGITIPPDLIPGTIFYD